MSGLGKLAYDAYCANRGWKSVRGEPLPQFDQQSPELQAAWEEAANAVSKRIHDAANKLLEGLFDAKAIEQGYTNPT